MEEKKNSKKQIIVTVVVIVVFVAICLLIAKPLVGTVSDPEAFREQIASKGIWGILTFMALNITQVIFAVIPGGPFEIAAGYAFGPLLGILVCEVAITLGSVLVFLAVRKIGTKFTDYFISLDKLESVSFIHDTKNLTLVLLLIFFIPGSPKDLLTYAVGFTKLPLKNWIFINLVGRLPAITLSVLSGSALGSKQGHIAIILWGVLLVTYVIGLLVYRSYTKKKNNKKTGEE